ncbi:MAG: 4Fe-4S ferredoxin, partial [Sulfolobus sp.]|nr:4Fe-4S ferredoxin [Sulfolobus sp.]
VGLIAVIVAEILSSYKRYKVRSYLGVASILHSIISYFFIYSIFIVFMINIISEIIYRKRFYEKILYYGLPIVL